MNANGISKENISEISNAAVSQSAHDVLVALFPASSVNADNLLTTCLSEIEDSPLKEKGIVIGKEAASAMLMRRKNDPAFGFVTYSNGTEPGVHQANYLPYAVANPPVWPANAAHIPKIIYHKAITWMTMIADQPHRAMAKGIKHETLISEGGHTWMNCKLYLTTIAQKLFK